MRLLIIFFIFFIFINTNAAGFENQVVASVSKDPVSFRKVKLDILLEGLIYGANAPKLETLEVQSQRFQGELNRYLLERVVYLESKSFSLVQVSQKEVDDVFKKVMTKVEANSTLKNDWSTIDAETAEIKEIILQKLASQKFVAFKSKSSILPITESEAYNHFQASKTKYPGKDFKDVKEVIKKNLSRAQSEERLNDWYDLLKKKYDVTRVF